VFCTWKKTGRSSSKDEEMSNGFYTHPGFHLIEILIAITILSITASFSLPLYSSYLVATRRLEAATTLSKLAIAMEQYHIEQNTYQNASLATLHFPEMIAKNNYQLIIQTTTDTHYLLLAKPVGKQSEKDQRCKTLTLTSAGEKGVTGTGRVNTCW